MLIVGGDTLKTKVPLGTHELRYASGGNWYGPDSSELFGPMTVFSKGKNLLSFSFDGETYVGHKVELILQAGGNFPTSSISREDF